MGTAGGALPHKAKYARLEKRLFYWWQNLDDFNLWTFMYIAALMGYLDDPDVFDDLILYEDLLENPRREIGKMFKLLKIPDEHMESAMKALNVDSQQGYFGQRGHIQTSKDGEFMRVIDEEFAAAGLPFRHDDTFEQFKGKLLTCKEWMANNKSLY